MGVAMTRIGCLLAVMLTGCIVGESGMQMMMPTDKHAAATIEPTPTNTVTGTAEFTLHAGVVTMLVTIANAPPDGMHGFHIRQNPACGNNGMDAGAHWDGAMQGDATMHGLPDSPTHHMGDTGNIGIGADGTGTLQMESTMWTLGDGAITDVVNHGVIFHVNADDGTMMSAGARLGCGIIAATD